MSRLSAHRLPLLALLLLSSLTLLLFFPARHSPWLDTLRSRPTPLTSLDLSTSAQDSLPEPPPTPPFRPRLSSIFSGSWAPKERDPTEEKITWGCYAREETVPKENRTEQTVGPQSEEGIKRYEEVHAWEWVPTEGGPRKEWDGEEFVSRLLESRVGMLFVGDSLTGQHFDTLSAALAHPPAHRPNDPPLLIRTEPKGRLHQVLSPNRAHPLFTSSSVSPAIPPARILDPVITYLRADHLLPAEDLAQLVRDELDLTDWDIEEADREVAGEDWVGWLRSIVGGEDPHDDASESGWPNEREGFLIWNTGAHWNRGGLHLSTQEQVSILQNAMINRTLALLPTIPHLRSLYRPTSPAHVGCAQYAHPLTTEKLEGALGKGKEGGNPLWGWNEFESFNDRWKSSILGLGTEDGVWGEGEMRNVGYLDIWELSLLRGDAHFLSPDGKGDCLHWCGLSVPWEWSRSLWHVVG